MKYLLFFIIYLCCLHSHAQNKIEDVRQMMINDISKHDSLERLLPKMKNDTSKANLLGELSYHYAFNRAEKSVKLGHEGVLLSTQLGYKKGIAYNNLSMGFGLWGVGDYSRALQTALVSLRLYEALKDREGITLVYYLIANIYRDFGDIKKAQLNATKALVMNEPFSFLGQIGAGIIGSIYLIDNKLDSANFFIQKAIKINKALKGPTWGWLYQLQGDRFRKLKEYDSALYYYHLALPLVQYKDIVETYNGIATIYKDSHKFDSGIFYANEVLQKWSFVSYRKGILQAVNILTDIYKSTKTRDSVIKYLELGVSLNTSIYNQENERNIQSMAFDEQTRQDEIIREQQRFKNQLKMYLVIFVGVVFFVIAILLWRNNLHRRKAYTVLEQLKQETDLQRSKAEQRLIDLKNVQGQLIQSEKMASLGELTAGIAHEIQNPLNFVNNFSEVNRELLMEMKDEMNKGNLDEANSLANDVIENEEKINHHGKRADAIVKGMLQHSRTSSGVKEPIDINVLCDEYFRLSYHGLRAKDKSFNATIKTDFDTSLEKITIIPQDIGRVILNLLNNSFYAVAEKKKQQPDGYEPTVSIITKKVGNNVEISVSDNGNGIPQKIADKIFQPFFTTKPTGQGTGLGLSLSYDIIKAHGGEIKVETKEGEGITFVIQLPII